MNLNRMMKLQEMLFIQKKYVVDIEKGRVFNAKGKELSPFDDGYGYQTLKLSYNGRRMTYRIHKIVAVASRMDILYKTVNHIDGSRKTFNGISNLEPLSMEDNLRHALETGLRASKLDEDSVRDIRRRYESGKVTQTTLAREFGVDRKVIYNVINNKTWTHVGKDGVA